MNRVWWICALLLAACAPQGTPSAAPTAESGTVSILVPAEGTVYYGDVITIRGTAQDLPPDGFDLRLLLGDATLALVRIVPIGVDWSALVPIDATDVGVLTIQAESVFTGRIYATATAALGRSQDRPAGAYGMILSPTSEDVAGGEQIMVRGVVSGVEDGVLMLMLTDERGREVQQVRVLVASLQPWDEVPFQVDLPTGSGAGRFTLALTLNERVLDEVTFFLGQVAG